VRYGGDWGLGCRVGRAGKLIVPLVDTRGFRKKLSARRRLSITALTEWFFGVERWWKLSVPLPNGGGSERRNALTGAPQGSRLDSGGKQELRLSVDRRLAGFVPNKAVIGPHDAGGDYIRRGANG